MTFLSYKSANNERYASFFSKNGSGTSEFYESGQGIMSRDSVQITAGLVILSNKFHFSRIILKHRRMKTSISDSLSFSVFKSEKKN